MVARFGTRAKNNGRQDYDQFRFGSAVPRRTACPYRQEREAREHAVNGTYFHPWGYCHIQYWRGPHGTYCYIAYQSSTWFGESGQRQTNWRTVTVTCTCYAVNNFPNAPKRIHCGRTLVVETQFGSQIRGRSRMLRVLQRYSSGHMPATKTIMSQV